MRTIVDIPDDQIRALDHAGKKEQVSRAEIIRRAVALYLEKEKSRSADAIEQYHGFLKNEPTAFGGMDGLAYQEQMRGEWDHRDQMYGRWGFQDPPSQPFKADDRKKP